MSTCGTTFESHPGSHQVLPAHHHQQRRRQHEDHRRGQEDRDREAHAELLHDRVAVQHEAPEDADHDQRRGHDHRRTVGDAARHRGAVVLALLAVLRDLRQQEHLVVHREAEQHGEHHQRDVAGDRNGVAVGLDAEDADAPAPLECGGHHAEGGGHAEQVRDGGLQRHQQRAERDQQHHEAERQHDRDHEQQAGGDLGGEVHVGGGRAADVGLDVLARDGRGDDR